MRETVVVHHGALGDGVILWPMLRALAPLSLVSARGKARLAAAWIDGVETVDGDAAAWARLFADDADMDALADVRRLISFVSDGTDAWARNVRRLAPTAQHVFVDPTPPRDWDRPVLAWHLQQMREQGVAVQPMFAPPRRNPGGPAVVHPGSGGAAKCWPIERVDAVIEHLALMGRPVCVIVGEVERERIDALWLDRWRASAEVVEPGDYVELGRLIARAAVYVGNDSGPTHLAGALGVPTVALFGPTDARVWCPQGPLVVPIAPRELCAMDWLPVEAVVEALARWS